MELFDFIKTLFKTTEYNKLKPYEKSKYFFMINRFMSINFPLQAQAFNHIKISQAETIDYWQGQLSKLYSRSPDWMSTKTGKKAKKKISWPSDEAVMFYLRKHGMSRKDLNDAVKLNGEEALKPIFVIDEYLNN